MSYVTVDTSAYNAYLQNKPTMQNVQNVTFDQNAWKQSYIDALTAQAQQTLDSTNTALDKNYNTSKNEYTFNAQQTKTDAQVNANKQYVQRNQDYQAAKASSFGRGLGNGGLGQGIEQSAVNNVNSTIADIFTQRNKALAEISSKLATLNEGYGADKLLASNTYNNSIAQATANASTKGLEYQLDVDKTNTDAYNKWVNDVNGYANQNYLANLSALAQFATTNANNITTQSEGDKNRELQKKNITYGSRSGGYSGYSKNSGSPKRTTSHSSGYAKNVSSANGKALEQQIGRILMKGASASQVKNTIARWENVSDSERQVLLNKYL